MIVSCHFRTHPPRADRHGIEHSHSSFPTSGLFSVRRDVSKGAKPEVTVPFTHHGLPKASLLALPESDRRSSVASPALAPLEKVR
jgi:hypothetical protein